MISAPKPLDSFLPFAPPLPGLDSPSVVEAVDVLNGTAPVGERVAVVGSGMTGLETAELLHEQGHEVVGVYEMAETIGAGAAYLASSCCLRASRPLV